MRSILDDGVALGRILLEFHFFFILSAEYLDARGVRSSGWLRRGYLYWIANMHRLWGDARRGRTILGGPNYRRIPHGPFDIG